MKKKKVITEVAKVIRKNTGRNFINSISLAKAFLKNKTYFEKARHIEGFVYESDFELIKRGRSYHDSLYETGEIFLNNSLKRWTIPPELYEIREQYFK